MIDCSRRVFFWKTNYISIDINRTINVHPTHKSRDTKTPVHDPPPPPHTHTQILDL